MTREMRFWRNVILVGVAHVALLAGLARWGGTTKSPKMEVMWMAATAGAPSAALAQMPETLEPESSPADEPEPTPAPPVEDSPAPVMTPVASVLPLPSATPKPQPSATPKASPTPKAKKAKSAESPKPKSTPAKKNKNSPAPAVLPTKRSSPEEKKTATVHVDAVKEGATGSSAAGSGAGNAAQFNWYGNMLHDRFFGAWAQPTTASATGSKMAALVQLRIEKDGRVSKFEIVQSSGNVVVDESVAAVGKRVLKVDSLPAGLAADGHYDVRIKFELEIE